jgi:hypothetical protein
MTNPLIDELFADIQVEDAPLGLADDEFGPEDIDPPTTDPEPVVDAPADGPTCEVCQAPIPWSGRGRKPRKCADHKTRTAGAAKANRRKTPARVDQLRDDIMRELVGFGKTTSAVLPVFGITMVARADKTAAALARIAENNPKVLAALEVATRVVPALDLAETLMALGIALMVDVGRVPADSMLAVTTGVSATWHEVHDEGPTVERVTVATPDGPLPSFSTVDVPPRFARIDTR